MKRRDLVKRLEQDGWKISHGANHDMAEHPTKSGKIPIPRHSELNDMGMHFSGLDCIFHEYRCISPYVTGFS